MRTRRRLLWCLSLIGVCAAMTAAAFGGTTHWGTAIGVPGLENTAEDEVNAISCVSPGNCSAAGWFRKGYGFVVDEKDGVWGTAKLIKEGTWLSGQLSISCATAGSCAAGSAYFDGNTHAFLVTKRHGAWGAAITVPGMTRLAHGSDSWVTTISCPEPGFCAAGGAYYDSSDHLHAFLVNERDGVWRKAIEVPGTAASGGATMNAISCTDALSCAAGGWYAGHPFVVEEKNGVWGKAVKVPGFAPLGTGGVGWVSCAAAGSCSAGGSYADADDVSQVFVVDETHGVWHKAIEAPGLAALNVGGGPGAAMYSLSCATAGSCAAAGSYTDGSGHVHAFVVRRTNGIWRKAIEVPGLATLDVGGHAEAHSISCAKAGFCGAGGFYMDGSGNQQAFVVRERNGAWNAAVEVPGSAALNTAGQAAVYAVSCGGARSCVAGGFYVGDFHATQSFVTKP